MQRVLLIRLTRVIQPAGNKEPGERPIEAAPPIAFEVCERSAPKACWCLPAKLRPLPPQWPDIQRAIGEDPEVQAAPGRERKRSHTPFGSVVQDDTADAGNLTKIADHGGECGHSMRPCRPVSRQYGSHPA